MEKHNFLCVASRGRYTSLPNKRIAQHLEPCPIPGKTNTLTTVQKDNLIIQLNPSKESNGGQPYQQNRVYHPKGKTPALCFGTGGRTLKIAEALNNDTQYISGTYRTHKVDGGFREIKSGKGACVPARARQDGSGQNVCMVIPPSGAIRIRRLTPTECARLQTIPDWYKWVVSETQQYKMLGNGWTVEVIKHIFSFLPDHLKQ